MDVRLVIDPLAYDVVLGPPAPVPEALATMYYGGEQTTVVPAGTPVDGATEREGPWMHLALEATLPFDVVGFFRRFADALADAGVPILPFASYRYDHVLVPGARLDDAVAAVRAVITDLA